MDYSIKTDFDSLKTELKIVQSLVDDAKEFYNKKGLDLTTEVYNIKSSVIEHFGINPQIGYKKIAESVHVPPANLFYDLRSYHSSRSQYNGMHNAHSPVGFYVSFLQSFSQSEFNLGFTNFKTKKDNSFVARIFKNFAENVETTENRKIDKNENIPLLDLLNFGLDFELSKSMNHYPKNIYSELLELHKKQTVMLKEEFKDVYKKPRGAGIYVSVRPQDFTIDCTHRGFLNNMLCSNSFVIFQGEPKKNDEGSYEVYDGNHGIGTLSNDRKAISLFTKNASRELKPMKPPLEGEIFYLPRYEFVVKRMPMSRARDFVLSFSPKENYVEVSNDNFIYKDFTTRMTDNKNEYYLSLRNVDEDLVTEMFASLFQKEGVPDELTSPQWRKLIEKYVDARCNYSSWKILESPFPYNLGMYDNNKVAGHIIAIDTRDNEFVFVGNYTLTNQANLTESMHNYINFNTVGKEAIIDNPYLYKIYGHNTPTELIRLEAAKNPDFNYYNQTERDSFLQSIGI